MPQNSSIMKENLIEVLRQYILVEKSNLQSPKLNSSLKELQEKSRYYRNAMKSIIPISELDPKDANELENPMKQELLDILTIFEAQKHIGVDNVFSLSPMKKTIKNIYYELYKNTEEKIEATKKQLSHIKDENELLAQLKEIEKTILKLKENNAMDDQDFHHINMVLNESSLRGLLDAKEEYELLTFLGKYMLTDHAMNPMELPDDEEVFEDIIENDLVLTDEELRELFQKYGYSYDVMSKRIRDLLKRIGKMDNIQGILEILKIREIHIPTGFQSKTSDQSLISALGYICARSKIEIVNNIINNIKEDTADESKYNEVFCSYLNLKGVFVSGTQREIKKSENSFTPYEGPSENGYYNKYLAIREFLIGHSNSRDGLVNYIMDKCPTVFKTSYRTFVRAYEKLISYEIAEDDIFKSPSCLVTSTIYEKLDALIELGMEDYYKVHPANSVINMDYRIHAKMMIARKLGLPVYSKRKMGCLHTSISDNKDNRYYQKYQEFLETDTPIHDNNVLETLDISTYFDTPELLELKEKYDEMVEDSFYDENSDIESNPYIEYLDNYYIDGGNRYVIDDIIISRRKVLRLMDTLTQSSQYQDDVHTMMYVLTYNSYFNTDQLTTILSVVKKMKEVKVNQR